MRYVGQPPNNNPSITTTMVSNNLQVQYMQTPSNATTSSTPSPQPLQQSNEQIKVDAPVQQLLTTPTQQLQNNRHSDPLGGLTKEKLPNFSDLAKTTPPFKDYLNNLQTYAYLQQLEQSSEAMQPRHTQITQQYSSSTDEGCDTDHGGKSNNSNPILHESIITFQLFLEMDDTPPPTTITSNIQRLNSYASSSSSRSSGVATSYHSKSLSQNLSCDSSRSNFSTFESLDLNLSDCSDLASSLPSCASGNVNECENKEDCKFESRIFHFFSFN